MRMTVLGIDTATSRGSVALARQGEVLASGDLHERGARVELEMLGIPDEHVDHGAQKLWRRHYGLDAEGIAAAVRGRWPQLVRANEPERSAG